ncbi:MAG: CNNM domain-containing protein [Elusimicrobia bacterium]|nr:CNNM domain-containing protein [Candidatus Obscuribacterium magneticum]
MNWITFELIVFAALIVLSGLFSAAEVAFTNLGAAQIKRMKHRRPKSLGLWEKNPARVLATLILSSNAVQAGVGVLAASLAVELSRSLRWPPAFITVMVAFLSGIVVLFLGEIVPKIWAKHQPVAWAFRVSPLLYLWSRLLTPVAAASVAIANFLLIGYRKRKKGSLFLKETELKKIFTHSALPSTAKKILDNVLDYSKLTAKDAMTPRFEIFSVSQQEPMEKIIEKVILSGLSRIPIYSTSLDKMVGLLYAKDLLLAWRNGSLVVLADLLRPLHVVMPDMPLTELMRVFKSGRHHIAIVREGPNSGNVMGLITLQDTLEAIVGEIKDEP